MRSSELRAIEETRAKERAERMRTSPAAIRRAITLARVQPREPGDGWESSQLRAQVDEEFRAVGARTWREENAGR